MSDLYAIDQLVQFATDLFHKAGMPSSRAALVAERLVDADRMGHDTHGLNLAANYLAQLDCGEMQADGEPTIINDRGPCQTWDGHYLSGVWLTHRAVTTAIERAREFGVGTVSIRRSHHIACLATFLPQATDQDLMVLIASSDPAETGVAPCGSSQGCFTPNPIAFGYPTEGEPVLIDISASITTLGMSGRMRNEGRRLPGPWLVNAQGDATDDPRVLVDNPAGALLPLGGLDAGHKGFGLALMVEALTSGLTGFGRADGPTNHGASVFVQVFDPQAFGGVDAMKHENEFLAQRCRDARPINPDVSVRLPGQRALATMRQTSEAGVSLYGGIMTALAPWAQRYQITAPAPLR